MRGSRNFPGDGDSRPLGSKIKDELDSAFRLLFKQVSQHEVSTELSGTLVVYALEEAIETVSVPLDSPEPEVSEDPISALKKLPKAQRYELLPPEAAMAVKSPCHMDPVLCYEPVLDELLPIVTGLTFENISTVESQAWPVEPITTQACFQEVQTISPPKTREVKNTTLKVLQRRLSAPLLSPNSQEGSRFYALPIKKSPIPPNRFSSAAKEICRKALAEKAKTQPNNIQLRILFERMDMTLFAGIQQDEQGNLLCTPKNELLGRNVRRTKRAMSMNMYLVYGFRLDNREDIHTLVPAALIHREKAP